MSTYQQTILIGNLGDKPKLINHERGVFCTFSVATQKSYLDASGNRQNITTWHRCIASGKRAENITKYTEKGHKILVHGELRYREYTNQ